MDGDGNVYDPLQIEILQAREFAWLIVSLFTLGIEMSKMACAEAVGVMEMLDAMAVGENLETHALFDPIANAQANAIANMNVNLGDQIVLIQSGSFKYSNSIASNVMGVFAVYAAALFMTMWMCDEWGPRDIEN